MLRTSGELCLIANLSNARLVQVPRPEGRLIFTQGATADEPRHAMQLDPWAVVWCLSDRLSRARRAGGV
jgi:hypothetical protein